MKMRAILLLVASLLCSLTACSSLKSAFGLSSNMPFRDLTISADPYANQATATQIDIVVVYDKTLIVRLPRSGPEWFMQKDALQRALAGDIDVISLQVPGSTPAFKPALPARLSKGFAIIAFANYVAASGQPAITLTTFRNPSLRLMPDGIAVSGK